MSTLDRTYTLCLLCDSSALNAACMVSMALEATLDTMVHGNVGHHGTWLFASLVFHLFACHIGEITRWNKLFFLWFSARQPAVFQLLKPVGQTPYPSYSDSSQTGIGQESPPPSPPLKSEGLGRPRQRLTPSHQPSTEAGPTQVSLSRRRSPCKP